MRLSRVVIKNFRCLPELELELDETTVLIGPNNAGKSSVLDAIRVALSRRWGRRGTGFTEFDVHLPNATSDPKKSEGIVVELVTQETADAKWAQALQDELTGVIQVDPKTDLGRIVLRMSCKYVESTKDYQSRWDFIGSDGKPMTGRGRGINLTSEFFNYLPVFYLSALRDASDEFSSRSQFWSKLLKAMKIPDHLEAEVHDAIEKLNEKLVAADVRLTEVAKTISSVQATVGAESEANLQVRPMPSNSWDVLSKSEIHVRSGNGKPWLPLDLQGQGAQSVSVLFLFDAFVQQLLPSEYKGDSKPFLALEEPEAHLHPQAARFLWQQISSMGGQKLITSHSPYFVQQVPIRALRILRKLGDQVIATSVPKWVAVEINHSAQIDAACAQIDGAAEYSNGLLYAHRTLSENDVRELFKAYTDPATRNDQHKTIRALQQRSIGVLSDDELRSLETCARRIRGEIFFATKWLLCEGQTEYLLLHAAAAALGYDLDRNGIAVIDCKNNGSAAHFVKLAAALGIPWAVYVDNDPGGTKILKEIGDLGTPKAVMQNNCIQTAAPKIENELMASGLKAALVAIATGLGASPAQTGSDIDLLAFLEKNKTDYAAELALYIRSNPASMALAPQSIKSAVGLIRGL